MTATFAVKYGTSVSRLAGQLELAAREAGVATPEAVQIILDAAPHRFHVGGEVHDWDEVSSDELAAIGADRQLPTAIRATALLTLARRGEHLDAGVAATVLSSAVGQPVHAGRSPGRLSGYGGYGGLTQEVHSVGDELLAAAPLEVRVEVLAQVVCHHNLRHLDVLAGETLTVDQMLTLWDDPRRQVGLLEVGVRIEGGWLENLERFETGKFTALVAGLCEGETLTAAAVRAAFAGLTPGQERRLLPEHSDVLAVLASKVWATGAAPGPVDPSAQRYLARTKRLTARCLAACYGLLDPGELDALVAELLERSQGDHACTLDACRGHLLAVCVNRLEPGTVARIHNADKCFAHLALWATPVDVSTLLTALPVGGFLEWLADKYPANPCRPELIGDIAAQIHVGLALTHRAPSEERGPHSPQVWDLDRCVHGLPQRPWADIAVGRLAAAGRAAPRFFADAFMRFPDATSRAALLEMFGGCTVEELIEATR